MWEAMLNVDSMSLCVMTMTIAFRSVYVREMEHDDECETRTVAAKRHTASNS